jgi:hypothetical protein
MDTSYDLLIVKERIDEDTLKKIKPTPKHDTLYLILETRGGDPNVGFRIMNLLNTLYKKIYIVVPGRAMSTGTLMALGGDKIFMSHSSSLGPLDLQIEHPNDGSWISTLDVRDTMNTLISHTEVAAKRLYEQTYVNFSLGKNEAARIANECAVALIKPIVDKIDPYHLHKSFRGAEVGAKYGATLLKTRMMRGQDALADLVSSYLANNYDTHGYAITLTEAKDLLQLSVEDLDKLNVWPDIQTTYDNLSKGVKYESRESKTAGKPASSTPAPTTKQSTAKKEAK